MRGQLATGIGLSGAVAAGATLVTWGAVTGSEAAYRAGVGTLLVSLACLVIHRSHCNTTRLIEHQTKLSVTTDQERQKWAAYGYRAGELDTVTRLAEHRSGATVVELPQHPGQRNGA